MTVYTACAISAIVLLILRRNLSFFGNAELGGPNGAKIASGVFMICLWLIYVILSSLFAYGHIGSPF